MEEPWDGVVMHSVVMEGLTEKVTCEQRSGRHNSRCQGMSIQAEGTARAVSLRQECSWRVEDHKVGSVAPAE